VFLPKLTHAQLPVSRVLFYHGQKVFTLLFLVEISFTKKLLCFLVFSRFSANFNSKAQLCLSGKS